MGRAFEVRRAAKEKTAAAKTKIYSLYSREIYQAAKSGANIESNSVLKNIIDKAKREQVPGDIIKRAIDKASSGASDNYEKTTFEIFGPGGSTLIVECLTNNINRTISEIRPALNKNDGKIGVSGSVVFMYDHVSFFELEKQDEMKLLEMFLESEIEVKDIINEEKTIVLGEVTDYSKIRDSLNYNNIEIEKEEIIYIPNTKTNINEEDMKKFEKMYDMLEEVEDVQHIFDNVE